MKYCSESACRLLLKYIRPKLQSVCSTGNYVHVCDMRLFNSTNGYLHYYRNAAKQRNIFYKTPTTIGTQIYRYRRTRPDCNLVFEKRMRGHRAMVVVCVDCTVTPINHSKILAPNSRRQHSIRNVRAPPCDSICPKCCRTKCPLECCTAMMPE